MTFHYLQVQRLSQMMEDFRESLREEKNEQELKKTKALIIEEMDRIIDMLEKEDLGG